MGKLIIENRTKALSDHQCLKFVQTVVEAGRISNNNKQYSYYGSFTGATGDKFIVASHLNKKSDKFIIYDFDQCKYKSIFD